MSTINSVTTIEIKKHPAGANRRQHQALIEQSVAGHSDAFTDYLTAMSRFHHYSFGECFGDSAANAHRNEGSGVLDMEEYRPLCEGRTARYLRPCPDCWHLLQEARR